jgi:hypothetical protein
VPLVPLAACHLGTIQQVQPNHQKNMTDPFLAKLTITGICLAACLVSFLLGRLSTWAFDQTEQEKNEEQD